MAESPLVHLSGIYPFMWQVNVFLNASGLYYALVTVGKWHAISDDFETEEIAKNQGCQMMADMTAELVDVQDA